jgi:hypothetical protein
MHDLRECGYQLIRGARTVSDVAAIIAEMIPVECPIREPFAKPVRRAGRLWATPEWPADRDMCVHNVQSYASLMPATVAYACLAPGTGGAILLCDGAAVVDRIPADLYNRLLVHGWLLTRSFRRYMGLPWEDAFGTTDRDEVDAYAVAHGIDASWGADGTLRTAQHRPAVVAHPVTRKACWFGHVAFLSEWSLRADEREVLVGAFGADGLPFQTWLGDGSPITADEIAAIQAAQDAVTVEIPLEAGDLLIVDNVGMATGRRAFDGDRDVVMALGGPTATLDRITQGTISTAT